MSETKEITLREELPVARFSLNLKDTSKNRTDVARLSRRLTTAITRDGANIAFGMGLKGGKIVIEVDNLDLIPAELKGKFITHQV